MPSEIVQFVDRYFPEVKEYEGRNDHSSLQIDPGRASALSTLVQMVDNLNEALLPVDAAALGDLRLATEHIRFREALLMSGRPPTNLPFVPHSGRQNAVVMIRRVLQQCPDTPVPQEEEKRLEFVQDAHYRRKLVADLNEVEADLRHGQWKSATVLGGSLIEALLLEAIGELTSAELAKSSHYKQMPGNRKKKLDHWDLNDYLHVAVQAGVIGQDSYDLGIKAKGFRNLIHPGKAQREQMEFNRATALTVRAALEHVILDLAK